jgi:hypothetical protein
MARARPRGGQRGVDDVRAAYDEAPYESYTHPQSAPGQLAAIAWMFGLDPPDVNDARVIEICCAAAGNLIPIDRDDGQMLDGESIRDVLAQQVDPLPQRLTEMKLMSVCDYTSVIDRRRRA